LTRAEKSDFLGVSLPVFLYLLMMHRLKACVTKAMKLLIGLGNPGSDYASTRHNAGFMVIDALARRFAVGQQARQRFQAITMEATIGGEKTLLIKPTTFMNRSGQSVSEAVRFFKVALADVLVIVDELYLPTGAIRVKPSGGAAGHNGLTNIQQLLGTDAYPRLRVGVGLNLGEGKVGKHPQMDQADFVLGRFDELEKPLLEDAIRKSVEASEVFVTKGLNFAMNIANAGEKEEKQPEKKVEKKPAINAEQKSEVSPTQPQA
jgi:PTH1 family peptidyl-tRNA hydrolase